MICAVLNTLAKLCDGNIPNQFVVHQHQIANILCRVLSREHEQVGFYLRLRWTIIATHHEYDY